MGRIKLQRYVTCQKSFTDKRKYISKCSNLMPRERLKEKLRFCDECLERDKYNKRYFQGRNPHVVLDLEA
jgi:hypothetical protein